MATDSRLIPPTADDDASPAVDVTQAGEDTSHLLARVSVWLADVALSSVPRDEVDDAA